MISWWQWEIHGNPWKSPINECFNGKMTRKSSINLLDFPLRCLMRLLLEDFDVGISGWNPNSCQILIEGATTWIHGYSMLQLQHAISSRSALKNNSQLRRWLWTPAKFGSLSMQAAKNGETDACADLDRVMVAQRFIRCVSKLHRPFRDTSRRVRQKYLQTMLLLCRIACVASSAANQDNTLTSRRNFSEPGESMIFFQQSPQWSYEVQICIRYMI